MIVFWLRGVWDCWDLPLWQVAGQFSGLNGVTLRSTGAPIHRRRADKESRGRQWTCFTSRDGWQTETRGACGIWWFCMTTQLLVLDWLRGSRDVWQDRATMKKAVARQVNQILKWRFLFYPWHLTSCFNWRESKRWSQEVAPLIQMFPKVPLAGKKP